MCSYINKSQFSNYASFIYSLRGWEKEYVDLKLK